MADIMPPPEQQSAQLTATDTVRDQDKVMLVLSYFGLLALIPYLTVKDSLYVKWHARQGLALMIAYVAFWVIDIVLGFIPGVRVVVGLLGCAVAVGYLVVSIMGIVKAFAGERWRVPVVSDMIADKLPL